MLISHHFHDCKVQLARASHIKWRYTKYLGFSFFSTKVHLYQALVMSVLLYRGETWTLLAADIGTLEAFHMKCLRQMLNIHWWDHITNEVLQKTGLSTISEILRNRRLSLFGHVARLDPSVPANNAP